MADDLRTFTFRHKYWGETRTFTQATDRDECLSFLALESPPSMWIEEEPDDSLS